MNERMDGRTDRQADRQTGRWIDRRMDRPIYGRPDRQTIRLIIIKLDEWLMINNITA